MFPVVVVYRLSITHASKRTCFRRPWSPSGKTGSARAPVPPTLSVRTVRVRSERLGLGVSQASAATSWSEPGATEGTQGWSMRQRKGRSAEHS